MSKTTNMATMRILQSQLIGLLYTLTVNVKKVFIKMKGEDKHLYGTVRQWTRKTFLSIYRLVLAGKFYKTFNIQTRYDRQLYCSLGSALYIRTKQPAPKHNCVYLLNFRDLCPRTLNIGTKLQPSEEERDQVAKSSKVISLSFGFNKIL
jgi:hypothetical protein